MTDKMHNAKPRAWQRMLSGRRLDLLDPSPEDIDIEDIAHGLARVARWNGQTVGDHAFSVAEHALIVEAIFSDRAPRRSNQDALAALLHDAPEYVIGDLISPFKTAIGLDYKAFELRILAAVHVCFGLPATLPPHLTGAIKAADAIAAYYEATRLAGFTEDEARLYFGKPDGLSPALADKLARLTASPTDEAERRFLDRFAALRRT
jgi:5'-deoxynucleotidase YfbR-like HD superfamily hydrolase